MTVVMCCVVLCRVDAREGGIGGDEEDNNDDDKGDNDDDQRVRYDKEGRLDKQSITVPACPAVVYSFFCLVLPFQKEGKTWCSNVT
jgi:hypothetical protein